MIYNRLYLNVLIRVILIALTCFGLIFSIYKVHDWLLTANMIVLVMLQIHFLVRAINRTNLNLEAFFMSLENNDTSMTLPLPKHNDPYRKLLERMNKLRLKFNNLRMENEKQYHYFKAVVENIGVGMILSNEEGKVELINSAGRKLLNVGIIHHLSALNIYNESLSSLLLGLHSGQQKMFRLVISGVVEPIAFKVNDHRFFDKSIRIISFQNIRNELEAQELESWQKLIRVLTHEIMNSTGPIISSIDTIREFLTDEHSKEVKRIKDLNQEVITDVVAGIEIIKERSTGLSEFISNFKSITQKPNINLKKIQVLELFKRVDFLLSSELKERGITMSLQVYPRNLEITADSRLFEHVILNLVYNALDALDSMAEKIVELKAFVNQNKQVVIQVIDHGKGIAPELMDKVFIPFFTTKEKGSGIGLSISKQLVQMHGGVLTLRNSANKGTCCEICLM